MRSWNDRWKLVAWVTTAIAAASLFEAAIVATHHLGSPWDPHARFHALLGGLFLAALSLVALLLAWGPLRSGERMTRIALGFVLFVIPGVPLAGALVVPDGGPPTLDRTLALVGLAAAAAVALALRRS